MWIEWNPSPVGRRVGDCAVRAVAKALDTDWESAYSMIALNGFAMGDMPSSDSVWGATLRQHGFVRQSIPSNLPEDYTVADFARDNPHGTFVLGTGGHVVTVKDGNAFDSWDSTKECPQFFWYKKER